MRLGSLCTGYGGLDLGAELALGPLEHVWHAEIDPDASTVLAAHWPDVPNLGDLTAVDWTCVEPVDVIAAGYPCQPFSVAGLRRGVEDERWIWPDIARAVRLVRPRWVLLENVPGHLGRGFSRVVGDLAALGYVGSWTCVRASDVGAPHRRERLFLLATDTNRNPVRPPALALAGGTGAAVPEGPGEEPVSHQGELLPTPTTSDAKGPSPNHGGTTAEAIRDLLPTPRASDGAKGGPNQRGSSGDLMLPSAVMPDRWGQYGPAIRRWESTIGRPVPDPTEPGRNGQPRLSPQFVEWLMGLAPGWVTDHVGRAAALRILGNGVVPQQGAHALGLLVAGGAA